MPKRWDRIVELAAERGTKLPAEPDAKALEQFLVSAKAADPLRFPDLSLSVIKLLGPGEYVVATSRRHVTGHFGLAVRDYAHSTAPNRRFPDLITQRLLKAAMAGSALPYENDELADACPALHRRGRRREKGGTAGRRNPPQPCCWNRGSESSSTPSSPAHRTKGTWVRLLHPPVEGRLESGFEGLDVGHQLRVQLVRTDVERGYIDFKRVA